MSVAYFVRELGMNEALAVLLIIHSKICCLLLPGILGQYRLLPLLN
jgi:hypothetical protein